MIDELDELNARFMKMYANVYENKKFFGSEEEYQFFREKIFEQYKREYERLQLRCEIEESKEMFMIREERDAYMPDRWREWSWRRFRFTVQENEAARLISEKVQKEVKERFEAYEKALQAPPSGQKGEQEETGEHAEPTAQGQPKEPQTEAVSLSEEEKEFVKDIQKPKKGKEKK